MGLEQLTVGMRLRVFTGFVLLGLLILSALSLYGLRDNMLEDRYEKTAPWSRRWEACSTGWSSRSRPAA